jgi:acetylglutamate kinase
MTVTVVKIGGNVIDDDIKLERFLKSFAELKGRKILVHGGGKIATQIASQLGIETKMVEGRRITDEPMRDVVTMVYGGGVNKKIVAALQTLGCNAFGLTGADGGLIKAVKRPVKTIDYGLVGDIASVNWLLLSRLLELNLVPVIAPLTFDPEYGILNTNADTQASALATSIADRSLVNLVFCFEKKGVLLDVNDDNSVIPELNPALYERYKEEGRIFEGMIPKLDNAFAALYRGVKKVIICEADDLLKVVDTQKAGTTIQL